MRVTAPVSRRLDFNQKFVGGMCSLNPVLGQFAVSNDYPEHVVEVVRHPGRQPPYRLHLLGLEEFLLQLCRFGYVVRNRQDAGFIVELDALSCDFHQPDLSGFCSKANLDRCGMFMALDLVKHQTALLRIGPDIELMHRVRQ